MCYVFYGLFEEFTYRTRVLVDCMNRDGHLRTVNAQLSGLLTTKSCVMSPADCEQSSQPQGAH
ncbi:hypothetical protein PISMIDRAFT_686797 [Pisolithus microcarpus 441]|uniref:Uncharacterized protein n=1 Tax=Pisolithus microcarpus 441 TaxID=765257 RepID=A0A0C9XUJ2_9AGAM|nr:hypothetical protein PISMIDRAFT_686797 [Pisolithus microcarpus 441]